MYTIFANLHGTWIELTDDDSVNTRPPSQIEMSYIYECIDAPNNPDKSEKNYDNKHFVEIIHDDYRYYVHPSDLQFICNY